MKANVTYRKEAREFAKLHGMGLVTLAVPGMVIQAPATKEEIALINKCIVAFSDMRMKRLKENKCREALREEA